MTASDAGRAPRREARSSVFSDRPSKINENRASLFLHRRPTASREGQGLLVPPNRAFQITLQVLDLAEKLGGLRQLGIECQCAIETLRCISIAPEQGRRHASANVQH